MISHIRVFKVCLLATVRILRKVLYIRGGDDDLNRSKMKEDVGRKFERRKENLRLLHGSSQGGGGREGGGGEEEEEEEEEEDRIETKKGA